MNETQSSIFLMKWKDQVKEMLELRYPNLDEDKVSILLDEIIKKKLNNRTCFLVNNYIDQVRNSNILDIFELIERKNLIMGGAGVLYVQHDVMENPLRDYIGDLKSDRSKAKNTRDTYDYNTSEYKYYDRLQGNKKKKTNSLYGGFGYPRFIFHNLFIAESVTSMGKNMITTATLAFEYFLGSNVLCVTPSEVFNYMNNIKNECYDEYAGYESTYIPDIEDEQLLKRLLSLCHFKYDQRFVNQLKGTIVNMPQEVRKMVYYKNNLYEFCRIPLIRAKLKHIIENLSGFTKPDLRIIPDSELVDEINDLWKFLEYGVEYKYPIFDRVRKGSYSDRHIALYTDTDSNMVSVAKWIKFVKEEILNGDLSWCDEVDLEFNMVNLIAVYLTRLTTDTLLKMGDGQHIKEEFASIFNMKNEFYFRRMLFTNAKKRYIALKVLKEGKLLANGAGVDEIKGFDFIKVNTKETLKNFYTDLAVADILRAPVIDKPYIFQKVFTLKKDIEKSIASGETIYFKQANVGIIEQYKFPYRIQGIKAVTLWNTLCPDNQLQLPVDIDVIPTKLHNPNYIKRDKATGREEIVRAQIKEGSYLHEFMYKYPDAYAKLEDNIFNNPDPTIALMDINVLAKPKNANVILPEWYYDIIDKDSIVETALSLIIPIMNSLGFVTMPTTSNTQHISNIVKL